MMNANVESDAALQEFEKQAYMNLETYRKNGDGVKTPLWFVLDGQALYVRMGQDSWKVKRLHNNPQVSIVPSNSTGQPLGDWVAATGELVQDALLAQEINEKFKRKYGLQKRFFDLMGRVRGDQLATLVITISEN